MLTTLQKTISRSDVKQMDARLEGERVRPGTLYFVPATGETWLHTYTPWPKEGLRSKWVFVAEGREVFDAHENVRGFAPHRRRRVYDNTPMVQ